MRKDMYLLSGYCLEREEFRYVVSSCETTQHMDSAQRFETAHEAAQFAVDNRIVGYGPVAVAFVEPS